MLFWIICLYYEWKALNYNYIWDHVNLWILSTQYRNTIINFIITFKAENWWTNETKNCKLRTVNCHCGCQIWLSLSSLSSQGTPVRFKLQVGWVVHIIAFNYTCCGFPSPVILMIIFDLPSDSTSWLDSKSILLCNWQISWNVLIDSLNLPLTGLYQCIPTSLYADVDHTTSNYLQ